jgi:methionyl-tRNA formyltransferase
MPKSSKPIIFLGSGPVAAESLRLLAQNFDIEAVITKPRLAHHKGNVPVIEIAEELGLKVETATNKQDLDQLLSSNVRPFRSELAVLVDFGIIVSQKVIDYFPLGIINSHFSILPEWRGADPITFAVLSGQKITGVSLMLLVAAMDEGPLLAYGEYELPSNITTPELTADLIKLSDALLLDTVARYRLDQTLAAPQSVTGRAASYSRKLTKNDGLIDWQKPAVQLEREVRAFIEWPKSRVKFDDLEVIITKAHVKKATAGSSGQVTILDNELSVRCGTDILVIEKLKPAGKTEMTAQAFLAGYGQRFKAN